MVPDTDTKLFQLQERLEIISDFTDEKTGLREVTNPLPPGVAV